MAVSAEAELSGRMVLSHRDLDPKNVMWVREQPYLIDWEAAGYVDPYRELIEVLNYWAEDGSGNPDESRFQALLSGYTESMKLSGVNWDTVLGSGYAGMLGWLGYSLKRALGMEGAQGAERKLGEEQVLGTIEGLRRYENKISVMRKWLSGMDKERQKNFCWSCRLRGSVSI